MRFTEHSNTLSAETAQEARRLIQESSNLEELIRGWGSLKQVRKTIAKAPKGGSDLAREHQDWRDTDVKMGRARSELVFVGPTT
jgi:hypothetical protein